MVIQKSSPFFATFGNITFYSVPNNYTVDTICPNALSNYRYKPVRGLTTLSGIGQVTINQNCFLKLPDDRIIEPHHLPDTSTDLGVSHITQALIYAPHIDNYKYNLDQASQFWNEWSDIPELVLPTWKNKAWHLVKNVFDPTNLATQSVYSISQIFIILFMIAVCCCLFPNFYKWVKTVLLIRNPRKYWTEKGFFIPYWNRFPPNGENGNQSRNLPFTAWWQKYRPTRSEAPQPPINNEFATNNSQNEELITTPNVPPMEELNIPARYAVPHHKLPPIPIPAPKLNTYISAGNPEPEIVHDTSGLTENNDWRANSHIASLQLKAINAPQPK